MKEIVSGDGVCDDCGCPLPTNARECPVCFAPQYHVPTRRRKKRIQK